MADDNYVFSHKDLDKMLDDALARVEQGPVAGPQTGVEGLKEKLLAIARSGKQTSPVETQ